MPELPEVQTIVRDLNRSVRGKVIRDVLVHAEKIVAPLSGDVFRRRVRGRRIGTARRRGKFILLPLQGKDRSTLVLLWHMRMTGHPLFRDERRETADDRRFFADPRNQHVRLSFLFTDGTRLDYADVRKFGTLHLLTPAAVKTSPSLALLGPDALTGVWTPAHLYTTLRRRKKALKVALLDQTILAGIGNIYADEILWTIRVHPLLPTQRVTLPDTRRLARAIRAVLRRAVRARGTSIDDYRDLRGRGGTYGNLRRVYQRTGQPCFRCRTNIAKLVVGGRGTHICPRCQQR